MHLRCRFVAALGAVTLLLFGAAGSANAVVHSTIGEKVTSTDGAITVTCYTKKQHFAASDKATYDTDINSPKSVNVHPDGSKYYVNSLEGGTTVVYDFKTNRKLKVIRHQFTSKDAALWSKPCGLFPFTHYTKENCADFNTFFGKPVESTFSHNGRYLWVPYYRRSFDINAQDPSAVAIIDTKTDQIIRMMEAGVLPKMIATSPDGKYVAISHWGNNTVGLIDISSQNPKDWKYKDCYIVDKQLQLNYSLTRAVGRDSNSGYCLRGTVFTPGGRYLLVGCMGGGGGIAVIDVKEGKYLGRVLGMKANVRHLVIKNNFLYLSVCAAGYVQRIKIETFIDAIDNLRTAKTTTLKGWTDCKVGGGARTIEMSPGGRYIFVACNTVSELNVVDTKTMKRILSIPVDSYPVGLDVSKDGRFVFVTSQGKKDQGGGNAVNVFKVDYNNLNKAAGTKTAGTKAATAKKKV